MDYLENVDGAPRFVCLKVTDKVPTGFIAANFVDLFFSFLDPVFPNIDFTQFNQSLHGGRRMGFTDGNQRNVFGLAARLPGGGGNPGLDARKSCCQLLLRRVNGGHRSQFELGTIITQTAKGRRSGIKIDAMVAHCGPENLIGQCFQGGTDETTKIVWNSGIEPVDGRECGYRRDGPGTGAQNIARF